MKNEHDVFIGTMLVLAVIMFYGTVIHFDLMQIAELLQP